MKTCERRVLIPTTKRRVPGREPAHEVSRWRVALAICAACLMAPTALAQQMKGQAAVEGISFTALPGDQVELRVALSEQVPEPRTFTTERPPRIVFDFPGVASRIEQPTTAVGVGMLRSVSTVEAMGRTRLVLNLVQPVSYDARMSGNELRVTLGTGGAPAAVQPVAAAAAPGAGQGVTNVDFRRGPGGSGQVIVAFDGAPPAADIRQEGGDIIVEFAGARLPDRLVRRLDVRDFATPVESVDTLTRDNRVIMMIAAKGDYEHFAYQADDLFTVEVRPLTQEEVEAARKDVYTGERLSLNFQDIEVRAVLQLLADFTDLNIVASDSVTGSITLRLKDVPWDQALDLILKLRGLGMRQQGNVLWIAPAQEIAAREEQEAANRAKRQELSPLRNEFVQINYAKAREIAALLTAKGSELVSDRGAVTLDERTNVLIIRETAERLAEMRQLIARLDIPVRQVMIDSRIVIAAEQFARDLGARLGVTYADTTNGKFVTTTGTVAGPALDGTGTSSIINDAIGNIRDTGQPYPVNPPTPRDRLNVNLPAAPRAGQAARIAFGILGSNYLIDLELSALQAEGKGEILSNPRVITADQQEAVIKQGTEIPYQEASSSGATSVSFKEAVLQLKVTPQITPDDRIRMDLTISQDSVGDFVPSGFAGGFVPSIDTRSLTTQVLVNNGETVVLGGIFEEERRDESDKVPLLGDIPLFGYLFKRTSKVHDKGELLIFVTPKILKAELVVP